MNIPDNPQRRRLLFWGGMVLLYTLIGMMNYTRFVTNELALGKPGNYEFFFIMETTGVYTSLLLLPLMIGFINRFPIARNNLSAYIPLHLLATVVFGVVHTLLMYYSRVFIFRLGDLGVYDYGLLEYRFFMEYTHQFFTYWLIYGLVIAIRTVHDRQQQALHASRLEKQLAQARLQALQMQLNPHFLFNTLNMISSTIYDQPAAADKMIANLSDLLRATLTDAAREEHTLAEEKKLVQLYVEIMKARFEDKLIVHINIPDDIQSALIPRFILQPLVENSIKYGMESLGQAEVTVQAAESNKRLDLEIIDNGPGFSGPKEDVIGRGIGLSSTAERLERLYGNDHAFQLQNAAQGGGRVMLHIPYHTEIEPTASTDTVSQSLS